MQNSAVGSRIRDTLVKLAETQFGKDVSAKAKAQPKRPIVDLFAEEVPGFSKYHLAKAYVRWTRDHEAKDLTEEERAQWSLLIDKINKALK